MNAWLRLGSGILEGFFAAEPVCYSIPRLASGIRDLPISALWTPRCSSGEDTASASVNTRWEEKWGLERQGNRGRETVTKTKATVKVGPNLRIERS